MTTATVRLCAHFDERVILVALGIDAKGRKHVLGLREGSTEKTEVVKALLSDLVDRGLDADDEAARRGSAVAGSGELRLRFEP